MNSKDDIQWANSDKKTLWEIGKKWAKRYSLKNLRAFQGKYVSLLEHLPLTKENAIKYSALQNRLSAVDMAIYYKTA